jgi:hypothetical protein
MLNLIPIDMVNHITQYIKSTDKIRFSCTNTYLNENIKITDFFNIDKKFLKKLDDNILSKYAPIIKLDAQRNRSHKIKISAV